MLRVAFNELFYLVQFTFKVTATMSNAPLSNACIIIGTKWAQNSTTQDIMASLRT